CHSTDNQTPGPFGREVIGITEPSAVAPDARVNFGCCRVSRYRDSCAIAYLTHQRGYSKLNAMPGGSAESRLNLAIEHSTMFGQNQNWERSDQPRIHFKRLGSK